MYTYTFQSQAIPACNKKYKEKKDATDFLKKLGGRGGHKGEVIQRERKDS